MLPMARVSLFICLSFPYPNTDIWFFLHYSKYSVRFDVLKAVLLEKQVFWDIILCQLVNGIA
jgi:hypothetical protein